METKICYTCAKNGVLTTEPGKGRCNICDDRHWFTTEQFKDKFTKIAQQRSHLEKLLVNMIDVFATLRKYKEQKESQEDEKII